MTEARCSHCVLRADLNHFFRLRISQPGVLFVELETDWSKPGETNKPLQPVNRKPENRTGRGFGFKGGFLLILTGLQPVLLENNMQPAIHENLTTILNIL